MTTTPQPSDTVEDLKQKLAAIEHERWSDWQKWVHEQMYWYLPDQLKRNDKEFPDGAYVVDAKTVGRWNKQIATKYQELSPKEQASDMEQVDRYWQLIEEYTQQKVIEAVSEVTDTLLRGGIDKTVDNEHQEIIVRYSKEAWGVLNFYDESVQQQLREGK